MCASSPDQLDQLRTLNPPPSGSSHTVLVVRGTELFNTKRLEGVAMISLNPFLSDSAENSRFTALPAAYGVHVGVCARVGVLRPACEGIIDERRTDDTHPVHYIS